MIVVFSFGGVRVVVGIFMMKVFLVQEKMFWLGVKT